MAWQSFNPGAWEGTSFRLFLDHHNRVLGNGRNFCQLVETKLLLLNTLCRNGVNNPINLHLKVLIYFYHMEVCAQNIC